MTATEVIAEHALTYCLDDEGRCSCGYWLDASDDPSQDRISRMHAAHVVSKLSEHGYSIVQTACDGSGTCSVPLHVHGCFADVGNCDDPDDHPCDGKVGSRPSWMGVDQWDGPCSCILNHGHDGECVCDHTKPAAAAAEEDQ